VWLRSRERYDPRYIMWQRVGAYGRLARIEKPIGSYLLMFPGWWGIAIASHAVPDLKLMALFAGGSVLMRSAGCAVNDMWDHELDRKVERTKTRPIASGEISLAQSAGFVTAASLGGLGILMQLNPLCIKLGVLSLAPVGAYPLAKRFMKYPQLFLGFTFNWGVIMGYAAVAGDIDATVVGPLYLGSAAWTMMYDTLYAHQDKQDDVKVGINSSALAVGDRNAKPFLSGSAALALGLWGIAGYNADIGTSFPFIMSLAASGAHMGWQIYTADLSNRANLMDRFVSNRDIGVFMTAGIVSSKMLL